MQSERCRSPTISRERIVFVRRVAAKTILETFMTTFSLLEVDASGILISVE
jgi:hypothetical protein